MQYMKRLWCAWDTPENDTLYTWVCVSSVRLFHMFLNNKPQAAQLKNIIWDIHYTR